VHYIRQNIKHYVRDQIVRAYRAYLKQFEPCSSSGLKSQKGVRFKNGGVYLTAQAARREDRTNHRTLLAWERKGWLQVISESPGPCGGVVLLTAEDGLADTVVPRLDAAGADRTKILALDAVGHGADRRPPVLPDDVSYLLEAAALVQAVLFVVDPIMAYLADTVNAHRDQDCRRALHPLALVAERCRAAVLVVRHLNKAMGGNPLYRGGGSIGIIGAARSGLLVARSPSRRTRSSRASTNGMTRKATTDPIRMRRRQRTAYDRS
jgi:hypothetical protein